MLLKAIILSISVTLASAADCAKAWDSSLNYPGGSTVSYNGANWKNTWWENPGWAPGAANGDGGWVSQGACGVVASSTTTTTTLVPKSSTTTTTTLVPTTTTTTTVVPKSSTTAVASSTTTTTKVPTTSTTTTTLVPITSSTTTTTVVVISTTAAATTTGTSTLPYCYDAYVAGIIYNPADPAADKKASLNGVNY
ncbi:UNVERIFIED_CONTAM: hypothetical protein HDU68_002695, partial [Siphonaria sp. JEL0065]